MAIVGGLLIRVAIVGDYNMCGYSRGIISNRCGYSRGLLAIGVAIVGGY